MVNISLVLFWTPTLNSRINNKTNNKIFGLTFENTLKFPKKYSSSRYEVKRKDFKKVKK